MHTEHHAMITRARQIAERAHHGQTDQAGNPYITHVNRVANYVDPTNPHAIAAALLHDTIEDSPTTTADLAAAGIPAAVIEAVTLLTRHDDQPPQHYYAAIREHPLAREVKLADLADNTDPHRLAQLSPNRQAKLTHKYAAAYTALGTHINDGHQRRHRRVPS